MAKYNDWLHTLQEYKESIHKDLTEMLRCKDEIQKMKKEFIEQYCDGLYLRDDKRIIISAPEIIIGNVYPDGTLMDSPDECTKVTVRTGCLHNESKREIINKSPSIEHYCVSPGIDGNESRVTSLSSFLVHSESITLQSEKSEGTLAENALALATRGSIKILADENITMAAQPPMTNRKDTIDDQIRQRNEEKERLEHTVLPSMDKLKANLQSYDAAMDEKKQNKYIRDCADFQRVCRTKRDALGKDLVIFQNTVSKLAAIEYEIKHLNEQKKRIEQDMNRGYTPSSIEIKSGSTSIRAIDADQKMCTYQGSGVSVISKFTNFKALDDEGGIIDGSLFNVNTQKIKLNTNNTKKGANPGALDIPAEGSINLCSKEIEMKSVDYERKDENAAITIKSLTKGSCIKMLTENVTMQTNDEKGKATGKVRVNSKLIKLETNDINPDNGTIIGPSNEGRINMIAHTVAGGYPTSGKDADKSSLILGAGNVSVNGAKKTEIKQDNDKAMLQMESGKSYLKSEQNEIIGKMIAHSRSSFKNLMTAEKAAVTQLEVKKHLRTPNMTEGLQPIDTGDTPNPTRKGFADWDKEYDAIKKMQADEIDKEAEKWRKEQEEIKKENEKADKLRQQYKEQMEELRKQKEKERETEEYKPSLKISGMEEAPQTAK